MSPADRRTITTVTGAATVELDPIKGSRFIGDAAPAADERAALGFVATVREREPGATHHCWAYRLADGRARSSDDGEPGGTAGPPILQRIEGQGLHDVVVVVTRHYGGTKLGTGGLIRAYGAAAAAVLEALPTRTRPVLATFRVRHAYGVSSPVDGAIAGADGRTLAADYGVDVVRRVAVPVDRAAAFVAAVTDATSGTVEPERLD